MGNTLTERLLRAVKAKCLECSGGNRKEVDTCNLSKCPLFLYRQGEQLALLKPTNTSKG